MERGQRVRAGPPSAAQTQAGRKKASSLLPGMRTTQLREDGTSGVTQTSPHSPSCPASSAEGKLRPREDGIVSQARGKLVQSWEGPTLLDAGSGVLSGKLGRSPGWKQAEDATPW